MPVRRAKPRERCPFSGEAIEIVPLATGDFQVRGKGWVSTSLFPTYDIAEWWVSHNEGAVPKFENPFKSAEVTEREPNANDETQASIDGMHETAQEAGELMASDD